MLTPDQFRINEAWIAIRINEEFLFVKGEPYDVYVLIDAGSCYVFGQVFLRVVNEAPSEKDVEELLQKAFHGKNQWADLLILTGSSPADAVFKRLGEKKGLSIKSVDLSELEPIVGPLKESFASHFIGKAR
ncbi:hypothetical protein [Desulfatiglans anilini]|uniref:hypothetical protein n=1 Tax=Desulfatiglans anilini TaxID=90728 RepID=UPI000487A896|nr:hypothetical protein [Desulfatiglans anilini]